MSKRTFTGLLVFFTVFLSHKAAGQELYGHLTIKTKLKQEYAMLWYKITIRNKDTILEIPLDKPGKIYIESVPLGRYIGTIYSLFNATITEPVHIQKNTFIDFNTASYYTSFEDTGSLLDKMVIGDTNYIYYNTAGNSIRKDYFMLIRDELTDRIVIKDENGEW